MRTKTAVSGSLSNKRALTDAEINAGFAFNTILESPDFNGQLFDIDEQVDIISKEICNFLTGHSVTPVGNDNTQLGTLLDSLFNAKQDTLVAGANITIDENNVISTTGATALNFPLFASMWMYCKPFNSSWVNANNYSWLYASMYVSAYNALVSQLHPTGKAEQGSTYYVLRFDNGEGETTNVLVGSGTLSDLQTYCTSQGYTYNAAGTIEEFECYKTLTTSSETIEGITITYYETYNGMKIITDAAEITNEETLYNLIGVDNYFILDEDNNRFKLPRTEWGFVGLRDTVGNYVAAGLPNITSGSAKVLAWYNNTPTWEKGSLKKTNTNNATMSTGGNWQYSGITELNASYENSIYGNSTTVQPPATQMYLYFYLGNTGEIVDHQIASIALELFNEKADKDAVVLLTGNQTINGQKTFNKIINSVTPVRTSSSTEVATTNFTHGLLAGLFRYGDGLANASLIYNGAMTGGSGQAINLPEPYTNYSAFAIVMSNNSARGYDSHTLFIPVNDIIREWDVANDYGREYFQLCAYSGLYWNIRTNSSTTSLVWYSDNSTIHQVWGIKM